MPTLKLTSKRQATFPARLCEDLRIGPGDAVDVEPVLLDGEQVWVLRPRKLLQRPWLGCLKGKAAPGKDHSLDAVRASIESKRRAKKS